jgi:hypothetical protein
MKRKTTSSNRMKMSIGLALQYLLDLAWDVDIHLGSRYDVYVDHECKNVCITLYMTFSIFSASAVP